MCRGFMSQPANCDCVNYMFEIVDFSKSVSQACLNLIEVGTIKKHQPHPETVYSTST